jgi:hypothetical protein
MQYGAKQMNQHFSASNLIAMQKSSILCQLSVGEGHEIGNFLAFGVSKNKC